MKPDDRDLSSRSLALSTRLFLATACLCLLAVLGWGFLSIPLPQAGLRDAVNAQIGISGVSNPVTAVLLNFRAYDTLLELAVLLVAVLGVWSLGRATPTPRPPGPVLISFAGILLPLLILVAAYLLWLGAHAPGGAFQAGALLGAVAVLLHLIGRDTAWLPPMGLRLIFVSGTAVFLAIGMAVTSAGRAFLEYPPAFAGILILAIEATATVAIGAILGALYVGGSPESTLRRPDDKVLAA